MNSTNQTTAQISCLQKNLSAIRTIAGWTAEQLGEKIGVTKQTISNLENGKTTMTLTQYIAIRSILDFEIQTNKENSVLPQVVEVLLNRNDEYTEEERAIVGEKVKTIAATAAGGAQATSVAAVSAGLLSSFLGFPVATIVSSAVSTVWLSKILKEKGKGK